MDLIKISDLTLWESFYWVAKKGSFTAAAHQMRLSVPFLSKKIARLEDSLGTRLFNRTTRRVSMTREAQALLPRVEALLEEIGNLERTQSSGAEAGLIRVTCIPAFAQRCLAPLVIKFQMLHPGVHFDLHVSDRLVDLIEMQIDVAIRVQRPKGAQFVFRRLFSNDLIWCASPSYLKSREPIKKIEDLKQHPLLVLPVYENCRVGRAGTQVRELLALQPLRSESGAVLTELVVRGGGVALRSRWDVAPLIEEGKLVRVLEKFAVESFGDLYAVTPHGRFLTRRVRLFLDFLAEACHRGNEKPLKT